MADSGESKRFPFIGLEKAMTRTKELFDADTRGQEMPVAAAFEVWGYSAKSSGGFQTVGALKSYGLMEASGNGKIKLTAQARAYFLEERDEERSGLLQQFALSPPAIASLWRGPWGDNPPADTVARSHLKVDRGFNEQSARTLLGIYKNNLTFAGLKGYSIPSKGEGENGHSVEPDSEPVIEGQYVQWTSAGQDQFPTPKRVVWVSEDGTHLRVHGSNTGIPMNEVIVTENPTKPPATARQTPPKTGGAPLRSGANAFPKAGGAPQKSADDFSVLLTGNQLEITATVDAKGLDRLMQVLTKYKEILKLLE